VIGKFGRSEQEKKGTNCNIRLTEGGNHRTGKSLGDLNNRAKGFPYSKNSIVEKKEHLKKVQNSAGENAKKQGGVQLEM